jgi:hypothetical protein
MSGDADLRDGGHFPNSLIEIESPFMGSADIFLRKIL